MLSDVKMYEEKIKEIESKQRNFDPFWGYASYEETLSAYNFLKSEIENDSELKEFDKKDLLSMIEEKIKKMPEVAKDVEKYEEELHSKVKNEVLLRYKKLSRLKKIKLALLKKNPKNLDLENMDVSRMDRLYRR